MSIAMKLLVGAVAMWVASSPVLAQGFPSKPVNLIVPYPPGGAVDPVARLYAQKLTEAWKVPVIIRNTPGAGGTIGINQAAKSEPDGYTVVLLSGSVSSFPSLYEKLPFDPAKDLTYLSLAAGLPLALAANPRVPVNTLAELVAYAKKNPGKLTYSTAGNGTMIHLGAELFKSMAGVDILHVPFKGSAASVLSAVAGETDLIYDTAYILRPQVNAGKLKFIASGGEKRAEAIPNVPTFAESYPGYNVVSWLGFVGPAKLPPEVTQKWAQEIARINKLPDHVAQLQAAGLEPLFSTPAEMAGLVQSDTVKWAKVIRDAKIPKME